MIRVLVSLGIAALLFGLAAAAALASQGEAPGHEPQQVTTAKVTDKQMVEVSRPIVQTSGPSPAAPGAVDPLAGIDLAKMRFTEEAGYHQEMADGRRVIFTVIPKIQRYADDLFDRYQVPAGAAVLLSSRTGRIIALSQERRVLAAAESQSVALDASPPAASLFKIVTTAALVERAGITFGTETCYSGGSSRLKMQHLLDALPKNHACVTLTSALGRSINAVYAKLSDRHLDRGALDEYAKRFGFNRQVAFDVPVPQSVAEIPADRLERARAAAGFWHTHLSPLHAAMIAQSLAQGGAMLRPYVVDRVKGRDGTVIYQSKTQYLGNTVTKETARRLTQAMVYTTSHGTARKSFSDSRGRPYLPGIPVSGKTGTLTGTKPYRAYTWFVGVAPVDNPEVAMAVLVVNEPKWHIKAPQMAALLLREYFEKTRR